MKAWIKYSPTNNNAEFQLFFFLIFIIYTYSNFILLHFEGGAFSLCWKYTVIVCVWSRLVMSDSLRPWELYPTRILCPWNSPDKNTGVGCHFLLQGSSQTRDRTPVSCIAGRRFILWATREWSFSSVENILWLTVYKYNLLGEVWWIQRMLITHLSLWNYNSERFFWTI